MISKLFSIRNYIMKQLMKTTDEGIMKLPDKGKVDFGEMIIKEDLFKKGIDPKAITSETQLDSILNTPNVAPKVKPKKSGEVIDVDFDKGRWKDIDPDKFAHGGRTGSGLNYLLGEDDQNSRVPYKSAGRVIEETIATGPDIGTGMPDIDKIFDIVGSGVGISTLGLPKWLLSKIFEKTIQGKVRNKLFNEYKDERMGEARQMLTAQDPYVGEEPWLSYRKKKYRDNPSEEGMWRKFYEWRKDPDLPTRLAEGGRIGYAGGGMGRRAFLKLMAALGATGVAAKSGLATLLKGGAKKSLTSVPIKAGADGMPLWFKPLVNKVIKEGDDVTKKFATADREIVHQVSIEGKIGKDALGVEDVRVTQNLDEGTIRVEYNSPNTIGESGVDLLYKKGEVIPTKKGSVKTKDEFTASEDDFYPQQTSPDDFDIEYTENIVNKVDDLYSDTSKLKEFATGKKLTIKEISEATKKKNYLKEVEKNPNDHAFRNAQDYDGPYEDDVFASGGRVPMWMGGGLSKGKELLRNMVKYFAKESTIGKKPSEYLKISNPKQYKKMLDDISMYKKYSPEQGIMAPDMIKEMIKKTEVERAGVIEHIIGAARNIKKADKSVAVYKKQMVDAMVEKGADKKTAEFISDGMSKAIDIKDTPKITDEGLLEMEQMLKNLKTKDRKLNATGGRVSLSAGGLAGMLGE